MKTEHFANLFGIFCLLFFCTLFADSFFESVPVSRTVSLDIPQNWIVSSRNDRITLQAWKEAVFKSHGLVDVRHEYPFSTALYDDNGKVLATLSVRLYPTLNISEREAISGGDQFIKELDHIIREDIRVGFEAAGVRLLSWHGTDRQKINGGTYFLSKMTNLSVDGLEFENITVRRFNKNKSFVVMVSYRKDRDFFLGPITDKIIQSIKQR